MFYFFYFFIIIILDQLNIIKNTNNFNLVIRDNELRSKLFNLIIDFCEKIKFLHLDYMDSTNISQLTKIIIHFNNYLKYPLGIQIHSYGFYDTSDVVDDLKTSSRILRELR